MKKNTLLVSLVAASLLYNSCITPSYQQQSLNTKDYGYRVYTMRNGSTALDVPCFHSGAFKNNNPETNYTQQDRHHAVRQIPSHLLDLPLLSTITHENWGK